MEERRSSQKEKLKLQNNTDVEKDRGSNPDRKTAKQLRRTDKQRRKRPSINTQRRLIGKEDSGESNEGRADEGKMLTQ